MPSDFLELLDAVTIARSRKHIERFYNTNAIGKFPQHLPAQSEQCPISTDPNAVKIKELNDALIARKFCVYTPTQYILPSRKAHYDAMTATHTRRGGTIHQEGRVDRIGSRNESVQLVNFWPDIALNEYIDLAVKQAGASLRVRSSVMEMLNLRIPNPCIFRVTDEEGGPIETAIYPKVSGGVLYGDSAVFRYARSASDLQMPSGVTTLESLLIHLAAELAGMSVRPGEPLKLFDERHYAVESLRAELADVEKKLSKEKQLNRKYELAKEKQRLQRAIDYAVA